MRHVVKERLMVPCDCRGREGRQPVYAQVLVQRLSAAFAFRYEIPSHVGGHNDVAFVTEAATMKREAGINVCNCSEPHPMITTLNLAHGCCQCQH